MKKFSQSELKAEVATRRAAERMARIRWVVEHIDLWEGFPLTWTHALEDEERSYWLAIVRVLRFKMGRDGLCILTVYEESMIDLIGEARAIIAKEKSREQSVDSAARPE